MNKVRMRQVSHSFPHKGGYLSFPVWRATYMGFSVESICPVWAYCEVLEKARKGY